MTELVGGTQITDREFAQGYTVSQGDRLLIIDFTVLRFIKKWNRKEEIYIPGFGLGGVAVNLASLHYWDGYQKNFCGLDLNFFALKRGLSINRCAQGDLVRAPFANDTFEYAVIADVLQDFCDFKSLVEAVKGVARVVKDQGQILIINPTAGSYMVETKLYNCSSSLFPENVPAVKAGMGREVRGKLKTINKKGEEIQLDFIDHVWRDRDLEKAFKEAGLRIISKGRPKAKVNRKKSGRSSPYWISETKIAPWVIYLLEVNKTGKSKKGVMEKFLGRTP